MTYASMKTGDTGRILRSTLRYDDGAPINLSGCTVEFRLRREGTTYATVAAAAEVVEAAEGLVQFGAWTDSAVSVPGTFQVEWVVTDSDSKEITVPSDNHQVLIIRQGIEPEPSP